MTTLLDIKDFTYIKAIRACQIMLRFLIHMGHACQITPGASQDQLVEPEANATNRLARSHMAARA